MLNVDKLYETETAHRNYFHLPLFFEEKEELRIKSYKILTGGWQNRYCPKALISVELSLAGKSARNHKVSFPGKNKKISQHFGQIFPLQIIDTIIFINS